MAWLITWAVQSAQPVESVPWAVVTLALINSVQTIALALLAARGRTTEQRSRKEDTENRNN